MQVYATSDVVEAGAAIHCPRVEMASRSKLSCVVWNSYMKARASFGTTLPGQHAVPAVVAVSSCAGISGQHAVAAGHGCMAVSACMLLLPGCHQLSAAHKWHCCTLLISPLIDLYAE
jgi:hypothetical protein